MEIAGQYFFYDGNYYPTQQLFKVLVEYKNSIYEVLRFEKSVSLFLEDHYMRFENSFTKIVNGDFPALHDLKEISRELFLRNKLENGNLRMELFLTQKSAKLGLFIIPHSYPSPEMYLNGVELVTFPIERPNPEIKQSIVNEKVRNTIALLKDSKKAYEVLLINSQGEITEGSKTNIFFIRNSVVYTPPSEQVLKGITRQKVLKIARENQIETIEAFIQLNSINTFDSCFLTGTSPKILPVSKIDTYSFDPQHVILHRLMELYNQSIENY